MTEQGNDFARVRKSQIVIGRRGKDLAFRLPKRMVERFGFKVGDTIDSSVLEEALRLQFQARPPEKVEGSK